MIIWQGLDGSAGPFEQRLMRLMTYRWFDEEEEAPGPPQRESGQRPKISFSVNLK